MRKKIGICLMTALPELKKQQQTNYKTTTTTTTKKTTKKTTTRTARTTTQKPSNNDDDDTHTKQTNKQTHKQTRNKQANRQTLLTEFNSGDFVPPLPSSSPLHYHRHVPIVDAVSCWFFVVVLLLGISVCLFVSVCLSLFFYLSMSVGFSF